MRPLSLKRRSISSATRPSCGSTGWSAASIAAVWGKLENLNPGGSVKDRICLQHDRGRGARRTARSRATRSSSRPAAIPASASRWSASVKGYRLVLTMPDTMSVERRSLLMAYGAELVLTPDSKGMHAAVRKAEELLAEHPDYFMPQQFSNPANPAGASRDHRAASCCSSSSTSTPSSPASGRAARSPASARCCARRCRGSRSSPSSRRRRRCCRTASRATTRSRASAPASYPEILDQRRVRRDHHGHRRGGGGVHAASGARGGHAASASRPAPTVTPLCRWRAGSAPARRWSTVFCDTGERYLTTEVFRAEGDLTWTTSSLRCAASLRQMERRAGGVLRRRRLELPAARRGRRARRRRGGADDALADRARGRRGDRARCRRRRSACAIWSSTPTSWRSRLRREPDQPLLLLQGQPVRHLPRRGGEARHRAHRRRRQPRRSRRLPSGAEGGRGARRAASAGRGRAHQGGDPRAQPRSSGCRPRTSRRARVCRRAFRTARRSRWRVCARSPAPSGSLRRLGFPECRVRNHDPMARIEVPPAELPRLHRAAGSQALVARAAGVGLPLRHRRSAGISLGQSQRDAGDCAKQPLRPAQIVGSRDLAVLGDCPRTTKTRAPSCSTSMASSVATDDTGRARVRGSDEVGAEHLRRLRQPECVARRRRLDPARPACTCFTVSVAGTATIAAPCRAAAASTASTAVGADERARGVVDGDQIWCADGVAGRCAPSPAARRRPRRRPPGSATARGGAMIAARPLDVGGGATTTAAAMVGARNSARSERTTSGVPPSSTNAFGRPGAEAGSGSGGDDDGDSGGHRETRAARRGTPPRQPAADLRERLSGRRCS